MLHETSVRGNTESETIGPFPYLPPEGRLLGCPYVITPCVASFYAQQAGPAENPDRRFGGGPKGSR